MTRKVEDMDMGLFKKIIDEIRVLNIKYGPSDRVRIIGLHGYGEPLLDYRLFERIEYIRNSLPKDIHLGFSTNAVFLTKEKGKSILKSGLDSLIISLDAAIEETYGKLRRGATLEKTSWQVERFLEVFIEYESTLDVYIALIETNSNKRDVSLFLERWGQYAGIYPRIHAVTRRYTDWAGQVDNPELHKSKTSSLYISIPCKVLFDTLAIYSNGDVTTCCFDVNGSLKVGDITKETLENIWQENRSTLIESSRRGDYSHLGLCKQCEVQRKYISDLFNPKKLSYKVFQRGGKWVKQVE